MKSLAAAALLVATSAAAADEVQFYQTVDRNDVGTDDTFRLTVVVGNAPDSATPQFPTPKDFELLSRSQSAQMSYNFGGGGPGTIQRVMKYVLVMRANRTGKLTLPPAILTTAAKTYKTEPIEMTVHAGHLKDPNARTQRPQPFSQLPDPFQNFPFPKFPFDDDDQANQAPNNMGIPRSDSDLFLKATVDKDTVYVGEQTTLALWIFSRVDLSSVDQVTMPKLDGFWSEDIASPTQLAPEQRIISGIPYKAYLLKKRALFPVKAGSVSVGTTAADITTGFLFNVGRVHRESNELTVHVRPLPPGAPQGFSGNDVGRWRLSTEVSQSQVELGQPITLRVILEGRGNLKNVTLPAVTAPSALKIYDPTTTDKVASGGRFGGRRVMEYLVMPQQTGTFELHGMSFPFFDPETGKYEVSRTDPIRLTVLPGASGVTAGHAPGSAAALAQVPKNVLNAGGLKPLRISPSFAASHAPLWRRPFFLPVAAAPASVWLAVMLVALVRGAVLKEDEGTVKRKKTRAARQRLAHAEKLRSRGEPAAFYGEVEKALLGFLEAKLGLPVGGLTREALRDKLTAAGVTPERIQRVVAVLDACDMGRFAPGAADAARAQVLDQAEDAMEAWGGR